MTDTPRADLDAFVAAVRDRAGDLDSRESVISASHAVLAELARSVTAAAARRLAGALPEELASSLSAAEPAGTRSDSGDFMEAVAAREGVADDPTAVSHVQAVLRAIADTADPDAVRSVADQLTPELRMLLETRGREAERRRDPEAPSD